jgi:signal transduction histidine kinase
VIGNALIPVEAAERAAPELAERARQIQASAERCGRIVRSFLAMARQRETQQRLVAMHELVDGTLGAAAGSFLARAGRPILEKPFVPAELRRLMTELARNN